MLDIKNFDRIRLESDYMTFMDVKNLGSHSNDGFMVTAYMMTSPKNNTHHKVEVRKKENEISLFTYRFSDSSIPDYWKDAEILFSWEE